MGMFGVHRGIVLKSAEQVVTPIHENNSHGQPGCQKNMDHALVIVRSLSDNDRLSLLTFARLSANGNANGHPATSCRFSVYHPLAHRQRAGRNSLPEQAISRFLVANRERLGRRHRAGLKPAEEEASVALIYRVITAMMRKGPPVPPAIFMGRAITAKSRSGNWRNSARFSKTGT